MKINGEELVNFLRCTNDKYSNMEFDEIDFRYYPIDYLLSKIEILIRTLQHIKGNLKYLEKQRRKL